MAQPEYFTETRTASWWSWRSGSASSGGATSGGSTTITNSGPMTITSEPWRGTTSEPSWVDNRPILGKIKGWFNRNEPRYEGPTGAANPMIRTEPTPSSTGHVLVPATPGPTDYYRRLPTTNEPPLGATTPTATPAPLPTITSPTGRQPEPIVAPKITAPAPLPAVPTVPQIDAPPQIEIEPLSFRPAGQGRGVVQTSATTTLPANAALGTLPGRSGSISPRFVDKVGQPGDYSWITGQLEIRNGTYILHYATPDIVDRFNGSLVLSAAGGLDGVRSGDLVSAHGAVIQTPGREPVYRVTSVDLVER